MLTNAEYKRNFRNVFVTYKKIGLSDLRIHDGFVDTGNGVGLTRKDVHNEICDIEDVWRKRREREEALKDTDQV